MKHKPVLRPRAVIIELGCVVFVLIIALIPVIVGFNQQQIAHALDSSGVFTQATVLEKRTDTYTVGDGLGGSSTRTSYLVTYGFEAAEKQIVDEVDSWQLYTEVVKGEQMPIRYLPENPLINEVNQFNRYQNAASSFQDVGKSIIALVILIALIRLPRWLQFRKFKSSPKETVQASITEHKVISSNNGIGSISHSYQITYSFETVEGNDTLDFVETIGEQLYKQLQIGAKLTVEYVIANPRIARCSLPVLDNGT
ncbi:MAG: hypothetical protein AAF639_41995 [Chloroflexota bacterium]